jgi:AP endonuclease-2
LPLVLNSEKNETLITPRYRPIGPGYDMGKSERPREQVDPQYKCDFFKWSSDVRKEMMAASSTGKGKKGKQ